jgi:transcriptional regulator with XRE-family HTH domain
LTLDRASAAAGIDLSHWQRIEAAQKNVTVGTLVRIAGALRVEVEELFVTPPGRESRGAARHRR